MRDALGPLQFVETGSIETDVKTQQVAFKLADKTKLDFARVKAALREQGYSIAKLLKEPKGS